MINLEAHFIPKYYFFTTIVLTRILPIKLNDVPRKRLGLCCLNNLLENARITQIFGEHSQSGGLLRCFKDWMRK